MIKLQHMAVIFVIIAIPLLLVLSFYISKQIDTMNLQTQYDVKLNDATHDAMQAFQLNTRNNEYATIADSLKRDVAAAVNTFYLSLASNMDISGTARTELQPYIPAILCTMYDGYYISSPTQTQAGSDDTEDLLKQYTYYTARYIGSNTDVTINYSLDSHISVYGMVNNKYVARSGYLIQCGGSNGLTKIGNSDLTQYKVYNPSTGGWIGSGGYEIKDGVVYNVGTPIDQVEYQGETIGEEYSIVSKNDNNEYALEPNNKDAIQYFIDAYEFTAYMNAIGLNTEINSATTIQINDDIIWEDSDSDGKPNKINKLSDIFDCQGADPESLQSNFVQHKREIIRYSIENNLQIAFNNFVGVNTFEYLLPKLTEEDWEKIYKNVSIVSFMQGIQVGNKMYNNYSVVTSTGNEEYVDPEEIYFINNTTTAASTYHRITCLPGGSLTTGYASSMFIPQNIINGEKVIQGGTLSGYIIHDIYKKSGVPTGKELYADYDCIMNANYESIYNNDGELAGNVDPTRKAIYYTALARERYALSERKASKVLNATP